MPEPPSVTSTTTSDPDSGSEGLGTGMDFIPPPGDVPFAYACDFFAQDCPRGEKCVPVHGAPGSGWAGLRCREVVDAPAGVGESCTYVGGIIDAGRGTEPVDDCDADSMCLTVGIDPGEGRCQAFCLGPRDALWCANPDSTCIIANDPWGFCRPPCDPLLQDCLDEQGCYPIDDGFACSTDISGDGGMPGDECGISNECDPGSVCVDPGLVPGCAGASCCTALCDLADPMPPCSAGQSCVPWDDAMPMTNPGLCATAP